MRKETLLIDDFNAISGVSLDWPVSLTPRRARNRRLSLNAPGTTTWDLEDQEQKDDDQDKNEKSTTDIHRDLLSRHLIERFCSLEWQVPYHW